MALTQYRSRWRMKAPSLRDSSRQRKAEDSPTPVSQPWFARRCPRERREGLSDGLHVDRVPGWRRVPRRGVRFDQRVDVIPKPAPPGLLRGRSTHTGFETGQQPVHHVSGAEAVDP